MARLCCTQYDDEEAEPDVDFADVHSGLDFVRACVRHAFDLTTPQAGALLQDNAKYLALVITNGMKGTFDAVFDLYDTVRTVQCSTVLCMCRLLCWPCLTYAALLGAAVPEEHSQARCVNGT